MSTNEFEFPERFFWGAGSSAPQIEGARDERGPSVIDRWADEGRAYQGHTPDEAIDFFHRFEDDIDLMKELLGLQVFRFSVSWPRVMPEGIGEVSSQGLDFYERLVDKLLGRGIQPALTFYHWDFPLALDQVGGWKNPNVSDYFADYAQAVLERLADRLFMVLTLNEPQCDVELGHHTGSHPPGYQYQDISTLLAISHDQLLAHGKTVQRTRAANSDILIGFAPIAAVKVPENATDEAAAYDATFNLQGKQKHFIVNTLFCDPIFLGRYPTDCETYYGHLPPNLKDGDLGIISSDLDFCGLNIYSAVRVSADGVVAQAPGCDTTTMDWEEVPEAIYWGARFFQRRYQKPLWLTENGCAFKDRPMKRGDGKLIVPDFNRINYLRNHLQQLHRAIQEGVDVRGYLAWTPFDNFEWARGYDQRFGLVFVDHAGQYGDRLARIPKLSGLWYGQVAESNGAALSREPLTFRP